MAIYPDQDMTLYAVRVLVVSTTTNPDSYVDNQNACVGPFQQTLYEFDERCIDP